MPHGRAIPFTKVHGLGNDFILIDALADPSLADLGYASLAPHWCDRHRGVGADGVLVLCAATVPGAAVRMRIINCDASEAEMCGNGVRCVARYVSERHPDIARGSAGAFLVQVGRPGAFRTLDIRIKADATGTFTSAEVDMGPPRLTPEEVPVIAKVGPVLDLLLELPGHPACSAACVSMGNPHAMIFVDSVGGVDLHVLGPIIEHHHAFPQRTNVQFVEVASRTHARVRTWERGAGPTLACGTGACAVLVAGVLTDRLDRSATISLPGGDLQVRWDRESDHVFMTGPAEIVFSGSLRTS
ncbi:MAG TPA: diaminopimelate epimerase [Phycisphaerales bacterium]|nr:diaminopimelate epimerase [Phycisphaerales bacterium]